MSDSSEFCMTVFIAWLARGDVNLTVRAPSRIESNPGGITFQSLLSLHSYAAASAGIVRHILELSYSSFVLATCRRSAIQTPMLGWRPNCQVTDEPRTMAEICLPSRCSISGRQGTRLKPMPSSSMAKRLLTSCRLRR